MDQRKDQRKEQFGNGQFHRVSMLLFAALVSCLLLAGCMPSHYTPEQEKKIADEHAADAASWFANNLPDAAMNNDVQAYTAGLDLYAAVRGTYEYAGASYPFIYDYYNQEMYLGHDHEAFTKEAAKLFASEFDIDRDRLDINFWGIQFYTHLENDLDADYDTRDSLVEEGLIPALVDPSAYAEELVYDGDYDFTVTVYGDEIPEYDHTLFERMHGLDYLIYLRPIGFDYAGTYRTFYSAKRAEYKQIVLTDKSDKIKAGYFYTIREEYDEDGNLVSREDPLDGSSMNMNCLVDPDGKVSLMIPLGASPIIFAPKFTYTSKSGSNEQAWESTSKKILSYYPADMDYIDGSLMVVPHTGLYAYYIGNHKSTQCEFNLQLPK